jgi:hypothetical protein
MEQRDPEWYAARIGRATSTCAKVIINPRATKPGRDSLIGELVSEIATANYKDVPDSFWLRHGRELEPQALAWFEMWTGNTVIPGTFQVSKKHDLLGDSPDGVVGFHEGTLEIKCPSPENHGKVLVTQQPYDTSHKWQIAWHMMIGGYQWCDYVSYCPSFPEHLRIKVVRMTLADIFPKTSNATREDKLNEAWASVWEFIDNYTGHLKRLGLTLE